MYTARHAAANPGQPAIIMGSSGETVTYAEYEARCNRLAHLLRAQGLKRGDHISIFMENQPEMLVIEGAAERTGLYYTLVNAYLSAGEVAYIGDNSRSRVLSSPASKRELAMASEIKCPRLKRSLITGLEAPARGWEPYEKT